MPTIRRPDVFCQFCLPFGLFLISSVRLLRKGYDGSNLAEHGSNALGLRGGWATFPPIAGLASHADVEVTFASPEERCNGPFGPARLRPFERRSLTRD